MAESRFIRSTGQGWKLGVPLVLAAAAGALIAAQGLIRPYLGAELTTALVLGATPVCLLALAVPCLVIRCPLCDARIVWQAVNQQRSSAWLAWILSLSACPICRYQPQDSTPAGS